jgi:membrane-associated phospholipid phosphatase
MAALIAVATVYGRYHYLVDAVAGLLMAGVALLITLLLRSSYNVQAGVNRFAMLRTITHPFATRPTRTS